MRQDDMIIPERFFEEELILLGKKIKNVFNFKTLKLKSREFIKINDKEINKQLNKNYSSILVH